MRLAYIFWPLVLLSSLAGSAGHRTSTPDGLLTAEEPIKLRVLTLNMYGLRYPPQLVWLRDESRCRGRFHSVGEHIREARPQYDIVGIQELYSAPDLRILTCDPRPFLNEITVPSDPRGTFNRQLFLPSGERWKLEADGGMGLVTPHTIERFASWRFTGSEGPLRAARGVLYARIAISGSALRVETYVVHLSAGRFEAQQRRRELQTLSQLIATNSGASGNPVLVLGDFNIDGTPGKSEEYDNIVGILHQPRDLWREAHPNAEGYTYDCEQNTLAQLRKCNYQARIDYVLVPTAPVFMRSRYSVTLDQGDVRLVAWHTQDADRVPVSDHYGLEAFLRFCRFAN